MKTTLVLPLLFGCAVASAEPVPPPTQPFEARTWSASMKRKPTAGVMLGKWLVRFEKTTLQQALSRASAGAIAHAGDAGESVYWLCYTFPGQTPSRLWATSHGEMGGSEHAVTGFTIAALESSEPVAECPTLPVHMQPVSIQGNIQLGMRERALAKAVGTPSYRTGEWISYDFVGKAQGNCPGGFDVLNSLTFKLHRGSIEAIYANQVTSC